MLPGTELVIGEKYFTKDGQGNVIEFTPTEKNKNSQDVWLDGFLARNIKDIENTAGQAKFIGVNEILQNGKKFVRSSFRNFCWIWVNRPIYSKSFDYYMCGCGRIISNCGFSQKHKCVI